MGAINRESREEDDEYFERVGYERWKEKLVSKKKRVKQKEKKRLKDLPSVKRS